jgi:hypothetical protein
MASSLQTTTWIALAWVCLLPFSNRAFAAPSDVAQRCSTAKMADIKKLEEWMTEVVTSDLPRRKALVQYLRQHPKETEPCVRVVLDRLRDAQGRASKASTGQKRQPASHRSFFLLAAAAGLPGGHEAIIDRLGEESSTDWLLALRSLDSDSYEKALRVWAHRTSEQTRRAKDLGLQDPGRYGSLAASVTLERALPPVDSLLFDAYLKHLRRLPTAAQGVRSEVSPKDWAAVHIMLVSLRPVDRPAVAEQIAVLITKNDAAWVESFRREPTWVQYRLLPLLRTAQGPECARELMWMVEHHQDPDIRAAAARVLKDWSGSLRASAAGEADFDVWK